MDFDYVSAGATLVVGLLSGATGGVLAAREIGKRTREGERRHQAITAVHGLLTEYRGVLDFHRNRLYENHGFPHEYAAVQSHEALAIGVLRDLPYLSKLVRRGLREQLTTLVGKATVSFAETRLYVPNSEVNPERESNRLDIVLRHILKEQGYVDKHGLLGLLLTTQNDADQIEHHARAIALLDSMIAKVQP